MGGFSGIAMRLVCFADVGSAVSSTVVSPLWLLLPPVTLYQVVDVEFVPGTRLPLYVGRHTEAGMTTGSHRWSQGRLLVSILRTF